MSVQEFWALIPMEFFYVYDSWYLNETNSYQTSWEQTRMNIYYLYCSIPKKNRNPSYQKFKALHIPMPWDKINTKEIDDEEVEMLHAETTKHNLDVNGWKERIAKMQTTSNIVKEDELVKVVKA